MASTSVSLLRKLLVQYAGVPNQEANMLELEFDEVRKYDTAVALLADVANVVAGTFAYAIDTEAWYIRGTSAFQLLAAGSGTDANSNLQTLTTVTAAEIKALETTPIELVAAVAGKIIQLHDVAFYMNYGSEVLAVAAGDDLIVNYVDASGVAASGSLETTGFLDQTNDVFAIVKGIAVLAGTVAECVNTPLILDNAGAAITGNASDDTTLDVWCRYSLLTPA